MMSPRGVVKPDFINELRISGLRPPGPSLGMNSPENTLKGSTVKDLFLAVPAGGHMIKRARETPWCGGPGGHGMKLSQKREMVTV